MTTSDIERRLTDLLHEHAEDAMSNTDTSSQLHRLQERIEHAPPRRSSHRLTMVAASVAAAAAVAGGAVWYAGGPLDGDDANPSRVLGSGQTDSERVAQRFVTAVAAEDGAEAASLVADDAAMPEGWRDFSLDRAYGVEHLLQQCETVSTSAAGARVECPFEYHARGSKELGMKPFGSSTFTVVVDANEVQQFQAVYGAQVNGELELRDDIIGWIEQDRPREAAFLAAPPAAGQESRWLDLWQQRIAEYVEAMTAQE